MEVAPGEEELNEAVVVDRLRVQTGGRHTDQESETKEQGSREYSGQHVREEWEGRNTFSQITTNDVE